MNNVKEVVEKMYKKKNKYFNSVTIGSTVKINSKIKESGKERIQGFEGVVIARKGSGLNEMITVRKISYGGVGVERTYPVCSPFIESVKIIRKGKSKRAKLYYLRDSAGKKAKRQARKFGSNEIVRDIPEEETVKPAEINGQKSEENKVTEARASETNATEKKTEEQKPEEKKA
ncbi:MAG TPA: 50S ribosomal protein L19 [Candidatus Goldiibacteriota bacterium]|nr:50S ribosomal protein L19 [Candidatus Goldiibacteriota bacterium]